MPTRCRYSHRAVALALGALDAATARHRALGELAPLAPSAVARGPLPDPLHALALLASLQNAKKRHWLQVRLSADSFSRLDQKLSTRRK